MATYDNGSGLTYPLTKMNFLVTVDSVSGTAAFSEVSGVEASVDVIEFRQGNAHSMAPVKMPGLVKHGNVTLKMGYTLDNAFKTWIQECVSETRGEMPRSKVSIELIDTNQGTPATAVTSIQGTRVWVLTNAWVAKYNAPDLNATANEVAIESVEIAYEELIIPNYAFELPKGYVDSGGGIHRKGRMRLATAGDEISATRDPRVLSNPSYLSVVVLSKVVTELEGVEMVTTTLIEKLFTADMAFLQDMYQKINNAEPVNVKAVCPECGAVHEVPLNFTREG